MDAQLAAIYGTGNFEPEGNDLEKMAAAELLVKLAEEEGVDLAQFTDQEIAGMITDLYKQAEFPPKAEGKKEEKKEEHEKGESAEKEKKEEEKVAEADFLGRVMAHSMVHELREIEKEAGIKETAGKATKAVGEFFKGRGRALSSAGKDVAEAFKGKTWTGDAAEKLNVGDRLRRLGSAAKKSAPELAAAGGLTAAGIAAHKLSKGKEKKGSDESALEALAQQAAFEMAKQAGYIDDEGNFLVDVQEKQASAVDQAVYARALQICEENGIPVEWNE